jgi:hypothetical protein
MITLLVRGSRLDGCTSSATDEVANFLFTKPLNDSWLCCDSCPMALYFNGGNYGLTVNMDEEVGATD